MSMLDKEDEEGVVEDNFERFQQMYHPIWKEHFKDCFDLKDGTFRINHDNLATRKQLGVQINDNVLKNMNRFSVLLFDEQARYSKQQISAKEREQIMDKLIREKNLKELLDRAVDKILLTHRNTKIFLFMMTGPFLILFQTVKYLIKAGVFFYLYRKTKQSYQPDQPF